MPLPCTLVSGAVAQASMCGPLSQALCSALLGSGALERLACKPGGLKRAMVARDACGQKLTVLAQDLRDVCRRFCQGAPLSLCRLAQSALVLPHPCGDATRQPRPGHCQALVWC